MKRTISTAVAASLLTVALAAPALAGTPTYTATATCEGGSPDTYEVTEPATKGAVRLMVLAWSIEAGCTKNSVETTLTPAT